MSVSKKLIDNIRLTTAQFGELAKAATDVFFFSTFCKVVHPSLGVIPFNLYPYQNATLLQFLKHRFNVILKFRQAGVTELISMYCLWLAMYHPHKNIIIISIKDRVAKKVLRKIKFMYRNLPDHLKVKVVNGRGNDIGTSTELEFANGSIISSIPTTEDAGRSEAVSLLVIDEAAIVRWAERIWAASFPTLSTGGAAIINSCVTGDTEIIGQCGTFRIDEICPSTFGVKKIGHLGIKVLTHTGKWQRAINALNKGGLETWEIRNKYGDTLKCTPDHKLLTPVGWRPVREIIDKKLSIIVYKSGLDALEEPPITKPPEIEVFKSISDFPNYVVSNLGNVYIKKKDKLVLKKPNLDNVGYYRISLWHGKNRWKPKLAKVVAQAFIGEIPDGYVVDHINCNPLDNYVTNLQIITKKENTQRAVKFSRGMKLGCKIGARFPNLQLIGLIRQKYKKYGKGYGNLDLIRKDCQIKLGIKVSRAFVSRIVNQERTKTVQISKLTLIKKTLETIYDIEVENDHSYITTSNYVNHNTAYGIGNFFHKLFVNAVAGGNVFNAIRLHWQMHPERDYKWYKEQAEILGPRKTAQEIDGDFLTSGNTVFDLADIRDIEDYIDDEVEVIGTEYGGLLQWYEKPKKGLRYTLAADIATGRANDFSAFTLLDQWGDEKASFKGKIDVVAFRKLLGKTGKQYDSIIAPESNDIGLAVASGLQEDGYSKLYYTKAMLRKKGKRKPEVQEIPGWYTTKKNRPVIIADLEEDVRQGNINIKDKRFCEEAPTFIYDNRNRPVALNKDKTSSDDPLADDDIYTDDSILAKAIGNFVRKEKPQSHLILPR